MTLSKRGHLDLGKDEELVVRLTSVGGPYVIGGKELRLVGRLRGYHYLVGPNRMIDCAWNNCKHCDRGMRRKVRYETRLWWEGPDGLEERTSFLSGAEHRAFAKAAIVIEAQGRDPKDVRLLWRYKPGKDKTVEVVVLN